MGRNWHFWFPDHCGLWKCQLTPITDWWVVMPGQIKGKFVIVLWVGFCLWTWHWRLWYLKIVCIVSHLLNKLRMFTLTSLVYWAVTVLLARAGGTFSPHHSPLAERHLDWRLQKPVGVLVFIVATCFHLLRLHATFTHRWPSVEWVTFL